MDLYLKPFSSLKISAPSPLQRSGSSSPISSSVKRKLPTIKPYQRPIFSCSNIRPYGHINRLNAMQIQQDSGQEERPIRSEKEIKKRPHFTNVLWRFTRPFILFAASVGYISVMARTWIEHPQQLGWSQLLKAVSGVVAVMAAVSYTSATNQLFDIEIDRINKPDLPIASGDLSVPMAWFLTAIFVGIGITVARFINYTPYSYSLLGVYVMATLYSIPPFSWKRTFLGAFLINTLMGGFVGTLIDTSAASATFGLPFGLSLPVRFIMIFVTTNFAATAILKDLSDVEGDQKYGVPTIPVFIGVRNSAIIAFGILLTNYIGAILTSIFLPQVFRRSVMIPGFTVLTLCLIYQIWKLHKANYEKEASYNFYQFTYKLLFFVYVLFPFI